MDRDKVVISPDALRPTVEAISGAAPSMFAAKLTREERLRRNSNYYPVKTKDEKHQQPYEVCEMANFCVFCVLFFM